MTKFVAKIVNRIIEGTTSYKLLFLFRGIMMYQEARIINGKLCSFHRLLHHDMEIWQKVYFIFQFYSNIPIATVEIQKYRVFEKYWLWQSKIGFKNN